MTEPLRRICVFCGSSSGIKPAYADAARALGRGLAEAGLGLVYGGGGVGLMGVLATTVLESGGSVIGVIPQGLVARELGHAALTELRIVDSMHERKAQMSDLSDGFIVLPGGAGTMEEFFEIWSWEQLGIHRKPVGLLNIEGYYAPLLTFIDEMVGQGFLRPQHRALILVDTDPGSLLRRFDSYEPPDVAEWLNRTET